MKAIIKKIFLLMCAAIISVSNINLVKADSNIVEDHLYYISIVYPKADQYVYETIGSFLNAESSYLGVCFTNVKVGSGIYIANKDEESLMPTFYYPVYINGVIEYVYQVYDDGNGVYLSTFGKTYVDEIKKYAANNKEKAGLWVLDEGNEYLLAEGSVTKITSSPLAVDKRFVSTISDYTDNNYSFSVVDVTEKIEYTDYPKSRSTYWDRQISYVETQGNNSWCAAYVTAAAIREISSVSSMRAKTIMGYYGKSTTDACSPSMITEYCNKYNIRFTMFYGVPPVSAILSIIEKWNLVYGGYNLESGGKHAMLIHGVDGDKTHVWNPWNNYSTWSSSVKIVRDHGETFTLYRYGNYVKKS